MFDTNDEATDDAIDEDFVAGELADETWLADDTLTLTDDDAVLATGGFVDAADDAGIPGLVGNGALTWGWGVAVGCAGESIPHATSCKASTARSKNRRGRILFFLSRVCSPMVE